MRFRRLAIRALDNLRIGLVTLALLQFSTGVPAANASGEPAPPTRTPIKHVIIIIGENRSFDHVFAT